MAELSAADEIAAFGRVEAARAAYSALYHARVPWGQRGSVSQAAGCSPQMLAMVMGSREFRTQRTPSAALARRIVAACRPYMEPWEADALADYLQEARDAEDLTEKARPETADHERAESLMHELVRHHEEVIFAPSASARQAGYKGTERAARYLLQLVDPGVSPVAASHIAMVAHDVLCVLGRPDKALYAVVNSMHVLRPLEDRYRGPIPPWLVDLKANNLRAQGVSLHALGLSRQAVGHFRGLNSVRELATRLEYWTPHFATEQINAMRAAPGSSRRAVLDTHARGLAAVEASPARLTEFLLNLAVARWEISNGDPTRAKHWLDALADAVASGEALGPLHRILYYRAQADHCTHIDDPDGRELWLARARADADHAGLDRQGAQLAA